MCGHIANLIDCDTIDSNELNQFGDIWGIQITRSKRKLNQKFKKSFEFIIF